MATIKFNDIAYNTVGDLPKVGSQAPDFVLAAQDLSDFFMDNLKGKRIVLNIFPSLDTEVCAASVRRFNVEAASYPDTAVICVSADLPFAAVRFCVANDIENVKTGSTFRSDFGKVYGVEIANGPLRGLMARSLVVIDRDGKVLGTQLVDEQTNEPYYDMVKSLLR